MNVIHVKMSHLTPSKDPCNVGGICPPPPPLKLKAQKLKRKQEGDTYSFPFRQQRQIRPYREAFAAYVQTDKQSEWRDTLSY